jgi:hypothetical protein
MAAPLTIEDMAKKKRGRPSTGGRKKKFVVYARIDQNIGDAIERFMADQRVKPKITPLVELAFQEFLEREGYWNPKS